MNKALSTYLDALRLTAAVAVLLSHATYARYTTQFAGLFAYGHNAVIVFFVLSGYVIAFVSRNKETSAGQYALARAVRIYSVAIPAIALTIVLDGWRMALDPSLHFYQFDQLWAYVPFYLAFATDWWFLNENMLSNSPFWSLSYEVWYYALFGAVFYFTGWRRWILAGLVLALVGPRHWLLLPIWLSGCWLYYHHDRLQPSRAMARCLFFGSIVLFAGLKYFDLLQALNGATDQLFGGWLSTHLRYSQYFAGDYLFALLVVINIFAVRYCDFRIFVTWRQAIQFAASFTFSLYLFHIPLLKFYSALFQTNPGSAASFGLLLLATVLTVLLLGSVTERKKAAFRGAIMGTYRRLRPRMLYGAPHSPR